MINEKQYCFFLRLCVFLFCAFAFPLFVEGKTYSYFVPPKGWEIASPDASHKHVKIGFIGPSKQGFSASINLATEQIGNLSMAEYLKAVKEIYERTPQNRFRQLGKIKTGAGDSQLIEIDTKTEWGDIRMMQMITLKDKIAYIVTVAAQKEEFGTLIKEFHQSLQSFTLTDDLFIPVGKKRGNSLRQAFEAIKKIKQESPAVDKETFEKEHLHPFEKMIVKEFSDMGTYWQYLLFEDLLNYTYCP